jgi:hypothetical protein
MKDHIKIKYTFMEHIKKGLPTSRPFRYNAYPGVLFEAFIILFESIF